MRTENMKKCCECDKWILEILLIKSGEKDWCPNCAGSFKYLEATDADIFKREGKSKGKSIE